MTALPDSLTKIQQAAADYIARGLQVVPLAKGTKHPEDKGWLKLVFRPEDFRPDDNIGLRSVHGLVDVDCDAPEVVAVASAFLPATGAVYGRPSKPRSHHLYLSSFEKPIVYKDLGARDDKSKTLIEIRVNHQSMAPPSRHPSGEHVEWAGPFGELRQLDRDDLTRAVRLAATAGLVARYYNPAGDRHDWGLALAGALYRLDLSDEEARKVVSEAARVVGDSEVNDRLAAVRSTYARGRNGALQAARKLIELTSPANGSALVKSLNGVWDRTSDSDQRAVTLTFANTITPRPVHWLWKDRLALGTLALIAGREGIGKTTFAYTLAADITRGQLAGARLGHPHTVIVAATEDSWSHTIVPRLMAAQANLERLARVDVTTALGSEGTLSLPQDNAALAQLAEQHNAALILLDPLISRLDSKLDTHKDADTRQALEPLVHLADATNAVVLGIIHVNKSASRDPLNMVMGSRAFTAVARAVLFVAEDPENEIARVIGQPKNNLGRSDLPTLTFEIDDTLVAKCDEGDIHTGCLRWTGETDRTIREIVEGSTARGGSKIENAIAWLEEFLTERRGAADSAELKAAGKAAGHTESTLKRALKELNGWSRDEKGSFPRQRWWTVPGVRLDFEGEGGM